MKVRDFMRVNQVTLKPQDSIRLAVKLLKTSNFNGIPVVDDEGKLIGLFTHSNLYSCLLDDISLDKAIEEYYIREVEFFREDKTFDHIKDLSNWINTVTVGQTPVVNMENVPIGMVTQIGMISEFLRHTEYLYKELASVIESVPAGILATDGNGYISITNKYAQNILQDVQAGLHINSFLDELQTDFVSIANGDWIAPRKIEYRAHKLFATAVPILQSEKIKGIIFVLQDLTKVEGIAHELKIVKELKTTLEKVLEVAYEGVAVLNEQGEVTLANDNFCRKINKTKEETIGNNISNLIKMSSKRLPLDVIEIESKPCVISRLPFNTEEQNEGSVLKVYEDLDQLTDVMQQINRLKIQLNYYKDELQKLNGTRYTISSIVSQNELVAKLKNQALQVAQSNTTILITGETGTGKELFAHAIHNASERRKEPFIKVNCSAIPAELAESELFGYEDGAFTGARKSGKPGKFEMANEGTLFLDEIGDMPILLQSKLLRVIQEKELERVGGTKTRKVDVRIIAATNKDLKRLVIEGKFREDLYFRLNVIELKIPPLRQRTQDIPVLIDFFVNKYNNLMAKRVEGITSSALEALKQYSWPGNIRELENTIERIFNYLSSGLINVDNLPEEILRLKPLEEGSEKSALSLDSIEMKAIEAALKQAQGNKSKAAKLLGISRSKLYDKLATNLSR